MKLAWGLAKCSMYCIYMCVCESWFCLSNGHIASAVMWNVSELFQLLKFSDTWISLAAYHMNNSAVVCRFTVQELMTFGCPLLFKVCWRREAFSLCGGVMAWMLPKWCPKWPLSSWPMNRYVCVYLGAAEVVVTADVFQIFCFYYTLLKFVFLFCLLNCKQ